MGEISAPLAIDLGCGEGRHCYGALERGARVTMASRSSAKGERACAQLRDELGAELSREHRAQALSREKAGDWAAASKAWARAAEFDHFVILLPRTPEHASGDHALQKWTEWLSTMNHWHHHPPASQFKKHRRVAAHVSSANLSSFE